MTEIDPFSEKGSLPGPIGAQGIGIGRMDEEAGRTAPVASLVLAIIGASVIGVAAFINIISGASYANEGYNEMFAFGIYMAESLFWVGIALFAFGIIVALRRR
jgi:hypothetical protein